MRVETSPLVRMAVDKPAVKIIQDTTSADSSADLFEGILRDAEIDLIMNQKPWLSGQPCREPRNTTVIKSTSTSGSWTANPSRQQESKTLLGRHCHRLEDLPWNSCYGCDKTDGGSLSND